MAILHIISLAIRLFALAWSLILARRIRDWRIGLISGIVALTAVPPIYYLIVGADAAEFTIPNPAILGVAASLFILFVVVMFQRAIQGQAETEKALHQTNDRLERARAELETRVQDRTASLRKSNEELRGSEERYKSLFDQSNEALLLHTLDGRIVDANARALQLLGLPRSEILALTFPQLLSPEAQNDAEASIQKLASAGSCTFETILGRKGGEPFRAEVSASRSVLTGQTLVQCILRDVTERNRAEDELRQRQKLEAMGVLAGGIAHDFNNVLTSIMMFTGLTRDTLPEGSRERANLNEALKASDRAKDLVRQILAFSKQAAEERKPIDIAACVKDALKLLRASIPATIHIEDKISDCGIVLADAAKVHQLVTNLCTNAHHAMGGSEGVLTVELREVQVAPETADENLDLKAGRYVRLTVGDTGSGIDPAIRGRIFDPFFSTKPSGKGTGLGLSVVHGIVTGWAGTIDVESEPGKGARFTVHLPQHSENPGWPSGQVRSAPKGTEHVLFVDDEASIVSAASLALRALGYKVTALLDAEQALDLFKTAPQSFDLVFSDVTMPGMTGVELARRMRTVRSDVPIILGTGFSELITEEQARVAGLKLLMKPYASEKLATAIREVLDQAKGAAA